MLSSRAISVSLFCIFSALVSVSMTFVTVFLSDSFCLADYRCCLFLFSLYLSLSLAFSLSFLLSLSWSVCFSFSLFSLSLFLLCSSISRFFLSLSLPLSIYMSTYLSIYLSVYLSIYLSISLRDQISSFVALAYFSAHLYTSFPILLEAY